MVIQNALVQKFPGQITDTTLPLLRTDRFLQGDGYTLATPNAGGVRCMIDLEDLSWPSHLDPTDGNPVLDLSEHANHATFHKLVSGSVAYVGNGFNFANAVLGSRIDIPPEVIANDIHASVNQYFLQMMWVKLPPISDWVDDYPVPVPFSTFTTNTGGFLQENDLLAICMVGGSGPGPRTLRAVRPNNGTASFDTIDIVPHIDDFGGVVQLAFWRNAAGQAFRCRSANGTVIGTRAVGAKNPADFSGKNLRIGVGAAMWVGARPTGRDFTVHRFAWENLETSGRDPIPVLDRDFDIVTTMRQMPFA